MHYARLVSNFRKFMSNQTNFIQTKSNKNKNVFNNTKLKND